MLRDLPGDRSGAVRGYFDARLLDVPIYRVAPHDRPPEGVIHLIKDAEKATGDPKNADVIQTDRWAVISVTPGVVYGMLKFRYGKERMFRQDFCDALVLDEASQMNLPEAIMAALALKADGQLIVVGDHRQMPPIVQHDWGRQEPASAPSRKQYRVSMPPLI